MHQNGKLPEPCYSSTSSGPPVIVVTVLGIAESIFRLNPQSLFLELLPKGDKTHTYMHAYIHI